jgi:hypothetical protein
LAPKLIDRKLQDTENPRLRITMSGKEVVGKELAGVNISAKRFISLCHLARLEPIPFTIAKE